MRKNFRLTINVIACAVAVATFSLAVLSIKGQQRAPASQATSPAYQPKRMADGHPDLNGIWQALVTEIGDPEIKCYMPGVPRITYMPFPFQIVQGSGPSILMAYEFASSTRIVRMNY